MSTPLARLLTWMRIPAPFFIAIWTVASWLAVQQTATGFLALFITVPVSFLQLAVLGLMLWLRPSVRIQRRYRVEDAVWYLGTLGMWMLGAPLPAPWGGVVQVAAFAVGLVGAARIGNASQAENLDVMHARAERIREHLADQAGGPAWGPGAGTVITIETGETWREQRDDPARGGAPIEAEIVEEPDSGRDDEPGEEWTATPRGER